MATGKKYYWIKLKDSFITSDAVDFLMSQPDGANYVVLYQMLLLKTANTNGRLERRIGEVIIPYDVAKIERDCKWFSQDTIKVALTYFKAFGLIYEDVDGCLMMAEHHSLVGNETDYAAQKRIQREQRTALPPVDNVHTDVHKNVHIDIRDKILDIRDKDIRDNNIKEYGHFDPADRRDQKADRPKNSSDDPTKDQRFMAFWEQYPRKEKKATAYKAWKKLKVDDGMLAEILTGLEHYVNCVQWQDRQYIPHPATFLNAKQWQDDPVDMDEQRKMEAWINGENIDGW